jgi:hypothetical protein
MEYNIDIIPRKQWPVIIRKCRSILSRKRKRPASYDGWGKDSDTIRQSDRTIEIDPYTGGLQRGDGQVMRKDVGDV